MAETIYNEKKYLFHPEAKTSFDTMHDKFQQRWDMEQVVFEDTLKKYDQFIAEIAHLLHQLGYSSALECSLLLSYIINSGALSNDFVFKAKPPDDKKEISYRYGTSIVKGEGCCRNYASMLCDVFEGLGLPTDYYYCRQGILKNLNKPANHVINLISFEDTIYGLDLYNRNRLYRFKNGLVMKELSTTSSHSLLYKPYYELVMGTSDLNQIKARIKRFQDYSDRPVISPYIYEDGIRYDAKRKIEENKSQLYDFHQKTKTLKRDIAMDIKRVYQ